MVKVAKGIGSMFLPFVVVGVVFPYLLESFAPTISTYIQLPPAGEVWAAFVLFGAMFAVVSFFQNAYSKGEFPWLFGKVGSGVVDVVFFTYLFLLLPKGAGSGEGIESTGLLSLIYLAVALSYAYLVLDFFDARRSRPAGATPVP
jgi:hypothetical protein